MALLHALVEAGFKRLVVCHFNHGMRGRDAANDARFVAALAGKLGLEMVTGRGIGITSEAEARDARYAFFAQVARDRRCRTIFLGHHADDQVETFLFNLFRGAGRVGLGGMAVESERMGLRIIRPMLGVWREEIDAYVRGRKLRFREDASNRTAAFTRNRIRHQLFPLLEKVFGRDVRRAVWRAAAILGAEEEWLAALSGGVEPAELAVPELRAQTVAQQRRRLLAWLRGHAVPDAGFEHVEAVRSLLEPGGPAKVNLPGGRHARRRAKRLFLET